MKLRNKKTGEIGNFCYGHTNELCVSWQKDDGFWEKQEYNSLSELTEEWEDYEELDECWYMDWQGKVRSADAVDNDWTKEKEIGNYFSSKEEAEKAVEKLKAWKRLKAKGFRFDGYDVAHKSNGNLAGQLFYDAGNYYIVDVEKDLDLLFGGEE